MKKKRAYKVDIVNCPPVTIYDCPSPQNAVRKAVRALIASGHLTRQPESTDDGGFKGVVVWLL